MIMLTADTGGGGSLFLVVAVILFLIGGKFIAGAVSWLNDHSTLVLIALPFIAIAVILFGAWLTRPSVHERDP